MRLRFTKSVGAGNDFIVVDNRSGQIKGSLSELSKKLSKRKQSIGADGLLVIENSKEADMVMRIFNADGSEAEMCGNGVRCIAQFAVQKNIARSPMIIETKAGAIEASVKEGSVKARMIEPKDLRLNLVLDVNGKKQTIHFINTGVPHVVKILDKLDDSPIDAMGRSLRYHNHFAPKGANVNFVSVQDDGSIKVRTYERGVEAETLSCGTGSTASALVVAALKGINSPVDVYTQGGDKLKVSFQKKGEVFNNITLEGPVACSFEGEVSL